jgi:hypothetical protein
MRYNFATGVAADAAIKRMVATFHRGRRGKLPVSTLTQLDQEMILGVTLVGLAIFVVSGFIIKARFKWSAGLYMIGAGIGAAALIGQWIVVMSGWHTTRIAMAGDPDDFRGLGLLPFTAALVIILYANAWASRAMLRIARSHLVARWRRVLAIVVLVPTIAAALAVTWFEADTILAAWFGNAGAFRRLAFTCHARGQLSSIRFIRLIQIRYTRGIRRIQAICDDMPSELAPRGSATIMAAIGSDQKTPPDLLYELGRGEVWEAADALANPHLPVKAFSDTAILNYSPFQEWICFNPHMPIRIIDSLIVRYPELRQHLLQDGRADSLLVRYPTLRNRLLQSP